MASKKVIILGYGPSIRYAPLLDKSYDIWTLNHRINIAPRFSKHFNFHNLARPRQYTDFLKQIGPKFVTCEENLKYYPNATPYPKEEIIKMFDTDFFTCSISWMIAYAAYLEVPEISLYGVELTAKSEYAHQLPSVQHILRKVKDKKIPVVVPPGSRLIDIPQNTNKLIKRPFRLYWMLKS